MGAVGVLRVTATRVSQRPGLLVPAVVALVLDPVGPLLGLGILAIVQFGPVERMTVLLLAGLVFRAALLTVVRPAILPAVAELTSERQAGGGIRDGVATLRRTWDRADGGLFVAGGVGRGMAVALAIPATLLLGLVALPVGTAFEVGLYALDLLDTPARSQIMGGVVLVPLLATLLALYLTGFAELFALDGEAPKTAWLASLRAVRTAPGSVAAYAVLRGVVLAGPFLPLGLAYRFDGGSSGTLWVLFGLGLALSIPARAVDEAFRVGFYREVLAAGEAPDLAADRLRDTIPRPSVPSATVVLAALLLVAAAVGAGVVRVSDARPNPEPGGPPMLADGSPSALYERAIARTTGVERHVTVRQYEYVDGSATLSHRVSYYYDLSDREQATHLYLADNGTTKTGALFFDDGQVFARTNHQFPRNHVATDLQPGATWSEVARTADEVVLGIDEPAELRAIRAFPAPGDAEYGPESRVRVWIRTDTQRLSRVAYRRQFSYPGDGSENESGFSTDRLVVYEYRYGGVDLQQPDVVEKGLADYLGDLLYY